MEWLLATSRALTGQQASLPNMKTYEANKAALMGHSGGMLIDRGGDAAKLQQLLAGVSNNVNVEVAHRLADSIAAVLRQPGAPRTPEAIAAYLQAVSAQLLPRLEIITKMKLLLSAAAAYATNQEARGLAGLVADFGKGKQVGQEGLESMLGNATAEEQACVTLLDKIIGSYGNAWVVKLLSFTAASLDAGSNLQPFLKASPNRPSRELLSSTFGMFNKPQSLAMLSDAAAQQNALACASYCKLQQIVATKEFMGAKVDPATHLLLKALRALVPQLHSHGYWPELTPGSSLLQTQLQAVTIHSLEEQQRQSDARAAAQHQQLAAAQKGTAAQVQEMAAAQHGIAEQVQALAKKEGRQAILTTAVKQLQDGSVMLMQRSAQQEQRAAFLEEIVLSMDREIKTLKRTREPELTPPPPSSSNHQAGAAKKPRGLPGRQAMDCSRLQFAAGMAAAMHTCSSEPQAPAAAPRPPLGPANSLSPGWVPSGDGLGLRK